MNNPYFHPKVKLEGAFGKNTADDNTQPLKVYDEPQNDVQVEQKQVAGLTSIIIPAYFLTYPLFHQTGNCIGSIREHTDQAKTPYEIILVINGDTGIGFPQEKFKQTYADKVIQNPENQGFAKAVNQGIRASSGEYIVIMNNDVQVYDYWLEDFIESLTKVDMIQATPMYGMPFARAVEANQLRAKEDGKSIEQTFSDFNDSACFAVKKSLLNEHGVFDERFFMYGEDMDFIRRIEKAGKVKKSTKRVNIHHIIGSTASGVSETPQQQDDAKVLLREIWGY